MPHAVESMDQAYTKNKLRELRALVGEGDRIAIVLQDDPDPDAMASAMALRTLLGRNKLTTPFFSFTPVTRPENRTMVHLLEIEITPATTEALRDFDRIAMVDVEPPYFGARIPRADIVIDHHPGYPSGSAPFEDVRVRYGSTATIMTEYLLSDDQRISERLATALMYGIRSDTVMLSRRVTEDDLQAFMHLYPLANFKLLRQIDRPEFPLSFARVLSRAMARVNARDGLIALHLGVVERDDLVVQMAELCLQFEGVNWVVVSGKLDRNLTIAIRNHGGGRGNAGEVAKRLFGEIGSAGGHRDMAKAVIPLRVWRRAEGSTRDSAIEPRLRELFSAKILAHDGGEGRPTNGKTAS
jgi:nanoRNase/pAp phosphatase (c-di-AMP/oligoRNAs hydrolase)